MTAFSPGFVANGYANFPLWLAYVSVSNSEIVPYLDSTYGFSAVVSPLNGGNVSSIFRGRTISCEVRPLMATKRQLRGGAFSSEDCVSTTARLPLGGAETTLSATRADYSITAN